MTANMDTALYQSSSWSEHITPSVRYLIEHACIQRYPARAPLIQAGDVSQSLFFILKGSVAVFIEEDGREIVVDYLNAGDFFGEMGLFEAQPLRTAWVKTRVPCEIAEISYEQFRQLARSTPDLTFTVFAQMSLRLRRTTRKVTNLAFVDVTGRIARCLIDLSNQPDAVTLEASRQIRITRQELGRLVGCSREMVGRVLKSLEEQNMIEVKGKTITLFDRD